MRFKHKTPKEETAQTEDNVDTQLELLKYATLVQSRIKTEITSDFTLCKLEEQDKTGVTEMTVNAYLARRKIDQIKNNSKWYKWNKTEKYWETEIPEEKKEIIEELGKQAFDMYMTKVIMTAVLNRNVSKNHLLQFLKNTQEEDTEREPTTEKKIKNKIIKDKDEEKQKD